MPLSWRQCKKNPYKSLIQCVSFSLNVYDQSGVGISVRSKLFCWKLKMTQPVGRLASFFQKKLFLALHLRSQRPNEWSYCYH